MYPLSLSKLAARECLYILSARMEAGAQKSNLRIVMADTITWASLDCWMYR